MNNETEIIEEIPLVNDGVDVTRIATIRINSHVRRTVENMRPGKFEPMMERMKTWGPSYDRVTIYDDGFDGNYVAHYTQSLGDSTYTIGAVFHVYESRDGMVEEYSFHS